MRKFVFISLLAVVFTGCKKEVYEAKETRPIIREEKVEEVKTIDVSGTTWRYTDSEHDWDFEITFEKGGAIKTTHKDDKTPDNDTWAMEGERLVFNINDEYAIYKGKFLNDKLVKGKARNTLSKGWRWKLEKLEK